MAAKKKCQHINLVPYEYIFGKRYKTEPFSTDHFDWSSVVMGAHIMKVRSYYCPVCHEIIKLDPRSKANADTKTTKTTK